MHDEPISLQRVALTLIIIVILGYLLIIGRNILVPLTFAGLFAFMLKPMCERVEKVFPWRGISIFIVFLLVLLPILGVFALLFSQLADVAQSFMSIGKKIDVIINDLTIWVQQHSGFSRRESEKLVTEQAPTLLEGPISSIKVSMSSFTSYFINIGLTIVYTFFFLFYRTALRNFILIQIRKEDRESFHHFISKIQKIIQKYLLGLTLVILILGGMNSLALWLIGIKYALFWGYMAGILAIVPYVGTFIGAILPFAFALVTTDTLWQPVSVLLAFNIIQIIESNIITPKVAGSSVKINPLAAIVSLIVSGTIWGVAGLVLALPLMAIIKVTTAQFEYLRPLSLLLSSEVYNKESLLLEKFDLHKYRLINFFRRK